MAKRKTSGLFKVIAYAIIAITISILIVRFVSGEDSWVCDKGLWVEHGNPEKPMPSETCNSQL